MIDGRRKDVRENLSQERDRNFTHPSGVEKSLAAH
jgi:hypothetical protein